MLKWCLPSSLHTPRIVPSTSSKGPGHPCTPTSSSWNPLRWLMVAIVKKFCDQKIILIIENQKFLLKAVISCSLCNCIIVWAKTIFFEYYQKLTSYVIYEGYTKTLKDLVWIISEKVMVQFEKIVIKFRVVLSCKTSWSKVPLKFIIKTLLFRNGL